MTTTDGVRTGWPRVSLAGVAIDLLDAEPAIELIIDRARYGSRCDRPLSVVSANLDHLAQFGTHGRWFDTLDYRLGVDDQGSEGPRDGGSPGGINVDAVRESDWLTLLDGAPLVAEASRLTGRPWPRLAGSDVIGPLLDRAEAEGITVGFLGGSYLIQRLLSRQLTRTRPELIVSGMWCPDRRTLSDPQASRELAAIIAASGTQLLVVGLGKPRQELWMAKYGPATGAHVLLAFGAVVDFLAGGARRAPRWAADHGLEWAWRLALEPRRLARRYLIDDPPSMIRMRRDSRLMITVEPEHVQDAAPSRQPHGTTGGRFVGRDEPADVVVHVVTYNSADAIGSLLDSLRPDARLLRLRVIVIDNASADATGQVLAAYDDVIVISTGGNRGYAGAINTALHAARGDETILVLNPDMIVEPGAVFSMYQRMQRCAAGIVVPKLITADGAVYPSIRHEPTLLRAFGDACLGNRFAGRPRAWSEMEYAPESYQHPHRIAWATGAALLVRADLATQLGDWDERFFLYSEETDYFRRARELGESIWYEPAATMTHAQGGSGRSSGLNALMAVNRIRYVRKYRPGRYAETFKIIVVLAELLRIGKSDRRGVLRTIVDEGSWTALPGPTVTAPQCLADFPTGSVIIPAHDEEDVIGRTLKCLQPVINTGRIEVIVACNGCSDRTADVARSFAGVRVLEINKASKIAALNAADIAASLWPRVYLDADIDLDPLALRIVLDLLSSDAVLAARPSFRYDDAGASWPVRAFYRARRRIPSTNESLWGAGIYAVSQTGHERFDSFPVVTADDLFVDGVFHASEKAVVQSPAVVVRTPRTTEALLGVLRRTYRGKAELSNRHDPARLADAGPSTASTFRQLLGSVHGPETAIDAAVYAALVMRARSSRRPARVWERDGTTRPQDASGATNFDKE